MRSLRPFAPSALVCAFACLSAGTALAQMMPRGFMRRGSTTSDPSYRAVAVSLPVNLMEKSLTGHVEFNLGGKAGLALEGSMIGNHQMMSDKDEQQTGGESEMMQARSAALLISRYSQPAAMAGFFWTLGAGYRQQTVKWRVHPNPDDKQINYALVDAGDQMLSHDAAMGGMTGHARVGYRFVGDDFPIVFGGFVGVQHYQAGVKDGNLIADGKADATSYAPMTDRERDKLLRQFETMPVLALELGFVF